MPQAGNNRNADADADADVLNILEKEAAAFSKDAEIDRIRKAFALDAYSVLDLQPGVTEKDIKAQYRKKSLLIHPDKTSNPAAPDAFDRLAKAQAYLLDEKKRAYLDDIISEARNILISESEYTVHSDELKTEEFRTEWRKKTIEVLVEEEARRRRQLKAQMKEEGRVRTKVEEEVEMRKSKRNAEKAWEEMRDERVSNWRDFQKARVKAKGEPRKRKKVLG